MRCLQGKIHLEVIDAAQKQEQLSLIVSLTEQPAYEISRQEKDARSLAFRNIETQLEQLMLPFGLDDVVPQPVRFQVRGLNQQRKAILNDMRATIYSRTKARVQGQQQRFQEFVEEQLNGKINTRTVIANSFGIEIPAEMLDRLAQHPEVSSISLNNPLQMELNSSTLSVQANTWWNQGFTGPGWFNAAVLDSGITFNPNPKNGLLKFGVGQNGHIDDNKSWVGDPNNTFDNSGHGTAVAGIIASQGTTAFPNHKGVAHGIYRLINGRVSSTFGANADEDDLQDAIEWEIFESHSGADVINISLATGGVVSSTSYTSMAKFVDYYIDIAEVLIVKSAGNEGFSGLTEPADAYNAIAVGNVRENGTTSTSNDTLNNTSSRNKATGRRMLDLVAPGTTITTSDDNGGFSSGIGQSTITGTSFAAPHVTGAVALSSSVMTHKPHAIKAVLLNTATDQFNPSNTDDTQGWDRYFGYGYLNLYRAYHFGYVHADYPISQGQSLYFTGTISPGGGDFGKMTIVWHRHLNSETSAQPLNDLDLILYDYTEGQWGDPITSSMSYINNVEQVIYTGSPNQEVLVEIYGWSVSGTEKVSLASMHNLTQISSPAPAAIPSTSASEVITDELGNNFPNPFNPDTWIPYAVAEESAVKIQIFDTQGQSVRTLDLGQKPTGRYFTKDKAAYWNGRNDQGERVASGAYFYYLEAGDFKATRKMVIMK